MRYFALVFHKRCIQKTGHQLSNFILHLRRMGEGVITTLNSSLRRLYSGRVLGEESAVFQDDDFHSENVMRTVNEPSGPEVCSTSHSGLLHTSPPPLIILPSVLPFSFSHSIFPLPPSVLNLFLSSLFCIFFLSIFLSSSSITSPLFSYPPSTILNPLLFQIPSSKSSLLCRVPSPSYQIPFSLTFPPLFPSSVLEF